MDGSKRLKILLDFILKQDDKNTCIVLLKQEHIDEFIYVLKGYKNFQENEVVLIDDKINRLYHNNVEYDIMLSEVAKDIVYDSYDVVIFENTLINPFNVKFDNFVIYT